MFINLKRFCLPAIAALLLCASCNSEPKNETEEIEITTMDSTSREVETHTEKLRDQTEKVEESLEKLDKEFDNKENN